MSAGKSSRSSRLGRSSTSVELIAERTHDLDPVAHRDRELAADHSLDHRDVGREATHELAFGRTPSDPFNPKTLQERADDAWAAVGLKRLTLHECRHTFASLMIAAGVNAKALSTYMGHANISITLDRYGHLMPGSEEEAAELLDTYLMAQRQRVEEAARSAGGELTGEPSQSLA